METSVIRVTGQGSMNVIPDVTRVDLSLISMHDTYEKAYEQAKCDVERVQKIMEEMKLSKSLPKTMQMDIDKKTVKDYDKFDHYRGEKFVGFRLTHKMKIDLGMDNVLLSSVIRAIGRDLKQAEIKIGYTVMDERPAQMLMLEKAVKDGKMKAELMAKASGCRLGKCRFINYGYNELHIYSQTRTIHDTCEACCCTEGSLDITPDDLEVEDSVSMEWELINE